MAASFTFNKNKLLLATALITTAWFYIPMLYKEFTYHKTTGIYQRHEFNQRRLGRGYEDYFIPFIKFSHQNKEYIFPTSEFVEDEAHIGDEVTVHFDPDDPSKAYVHSFLGYWGVPLMFIIPIIVGMAGIFLGIEMNLAARKKR